MKWLDLEPAHFAPAPKEKPHAYMVRSHGAAYGAVCGGCIHLRRYKQEASWMKCSKFPWNTGGHATDWRAKWQACGLYQRQEYA